ncbi:MAG: carboxypeptidase regulatory-like domain-containing protein [Bryobacteraceae bacterium]|jgi:protocatechuate 3,4-dioxygenase beta subunit
MSLSVAALLFAAGTASAQTFAWSPAHGSISGTVTDAGTKAPLAGRTVSVQLAAPDGGGFSPFPSPGGGFRATAFTAQTDVLGHYTVSDLAQANYTVSVSGSDILPARATVSLSAGEDHTGVDFAVVISARLSGAVMDHAKYPMIRVPVLLLEKFYQNGKPAYRQVSRATTDSQGNYHLDRAVKPGGVYALLADPVLRGMPAISGAPEDPQKRDPVLAPAYYMKSGFIEGAVTISPRPGQEIEGLDIEMERVKSYCVAGVTLAEGKPTSLSFEIAPPAIPPGPAGPGMIPISPPSSMTGSEGQFRVCGLPPGEYRFTAASASRPVAPSQHQLFGALPVSVTDHDLARLQIDALPGFSLSGEVVWDGDGPAKQASAQVQVSLVPAVSNAGRAAVAAPLPGRFVATGVLPDEYFVQASAPTGYYIKEITYGGLSVLHQTFQTIAGATLTVFVARDGGAITAKLTDKDGNPLPSATVWFLPATARTPAELETVLTSATTDAAGLCASGTLPPGKYTVFATIESFDRTAAHIDSLWSARSKGTEVELGPNGSAQVSLEPITIF